MSDWIPWSAYYDTGIPGIDEQHGDLFWQFGLVCDAAWDGKGTDSIKGYLLPPKEPIGLSEARPRNLQGRWKPDLEQVTEEEKLA